MSRSFDDKMRERLFGYSQQPPGGAKQRVLNEVSSPAPGLFYFYQTLSALLILTALFRIGHISDTTNKTPEQTISKISEPVEGYKPKKLIVENRFRKENQADNVLADAEDEIEAFEMEHVETESHLRSHTAWVDKEKFGYYEIGVDQAPRTVLPYRTNQKSARKRIIPQKRQWATPYYNVGAFFIYNRVRPNLKDDIYVGEYDAPFSLSASRIGLVGEVGLHRQWSDFFALRLGISLSNYGQSYSFTVRNTRPDSVSINEEKRLMEPHFKTEDIQISKRITLAGIKVQGFWTVFQNTSNVLFASAEYQKLLGRGPQFTYENRDYYLMKPSQLLTEVGLRKQVFELKTGDIYFMPNIRYSLNKLGDSDIISVKPFSVGVTISYSSR